MPLWVGELQARGSIEGLEIVQVVHFCLLEAKARAFDCSQIVGQHSVAQMTQLKV